MKRILTILFFLTFSHSIYAQKIDSLKFYQNSLMKINRNIYDSLMKDKEYLKLVEDYERWRAKKKINVTIDGVFDFVQNDFTSLNNSLDINRLNGLSAQSYRIGMGMCFEKNNKILKMNFFSIGLNQESQNVNNIFKHHQVDLFQSSFGLILLNYGRFKVFPYFGGSYRIVNLRLNDSKNINETKWASKSHLNVLYGAELDLRVSKIPQSKFSKYIFVSFQKVMPFRNKPFDNDFLGLMNNTQEGRTIISTGLKWHITN